MRHVAVLLLASVAGSIACHHGGPPAPEMPRPEPRVDMAPLADASRIYYDNGIAFGDSARIIVRDTVQWRSIWRQATQGQPSPPPRPVVDFGKDMVLVAAAGRMKPGDVIRVDSVGTRGSTMYVAVRITVACQPFPTDAFPFEIVRLPRNDGPVLFREHRGRAPECS